MAALMGRGVLPGGAQEGTQTGDRVVAVLSDVLDPAREFAGPIRGDVDEAGLDESGELLIR